MTLIPDAPSNHGTWALVYDVLGAEMIDGEERTAVKSLTRSSRRSSSASRSSDDPAIAMFTIGRRDRLLFHERT